MDFEILEELREVETIAIGPGIREVARLRKLYGRGRWRKREGIACVRLARGTEVEVEMTLVRSPHHRSAGVQDQAVC